MGEIWKLAAADLERIRRKEIRELDTYKTIQLLCGSRDYTKPPYAPKPWSGLVEQQRLFKKAAKRDDTSRESWDEARILFFGSCSREVLSQGSCHSRANLSGCETPRAASASGAEKGQAIDTIVNQMVRKEMELIEELTLS